MAKLKLQGHASGTGVFTLSPPNSSTDRTITLPDSSGALLTDGSTIGTSQIADDAVTADKLANSINTDIAAKLPLAGGTMTGNLVMPDGGNIGSASDTDAISIAANGETSFTSGIKLADNKKLKAGSGEDLELYHDGSHSYLTEAGTGNLKLRSNGAAVSIEESDGTNMILCRTGGSMDLYHNGTKKLETTSTGALVSGTLGVTTVDLGDWTITESSGVLYFATGGTNKMKLDASGNLTCVGDVTANGSM